MMISRLLKEKGGYTSLLNNLNPAFHSSEERKSNWKEMVLLKTHNMTSVLMGTRILPKAGATY